MIKIKCSELGFYYITNNNKYLDIGFNTRDFKWYWKTRKDAEKFLKEYIISLGYYVTHLDETQKYPDGSYGYFVERNGKYLTKECSWEQFNTCIAKKFAFQRIEEIANLLCPLEKENGKMIAIATPVEAMNQHVQQRLFDIGFVQEFSGKSEFSYLTSKFVYINEKGNIDGKDKSYELEELSYSKFFEQAKEIFDKQHTIKLNNSYTAKVDKDGVHVKCQTFSLDKAIELGIMARNMKHGKNGN